jgi:cellobiose-specific phosphotransferase system component IIC
MSVWSQVTCDPVDPVFVSVPWKLPGIIISVLKTIVSLHI